MARIIWRITNKTIKLSWILHCIFKTFRISNLPVKIKKPMITVMRNRINFLVNGWQLIPHKSKFKEIFQVRISKKHLLLLFMDYLTLIAIHFHWISQKFQLANIPDSYQHWLIQKLKTNSQLDRLTQLLKVLKLQGSSEKQTNEEYPLCHQHLDQQARIWTTN